jgi:hypothetical protein
MTRSFRQTAVLLALVDLLLLGIGVVACIDLNRLQTPGGTALRWIQAAVFGDCDDYRSFSVVAPTRPESRSDSELCQDLRAATAQARREQLRIGLRLGEVTERPPDATAAVVLSRDGKDTTVLVHLVRRDGVWKVLLDDSTCSSVGCA